MNSTIGSWSAPETSSSNRGGWNADGTSKNGDGVLDDGTAIWGNPTSKKTGVDWAEKESLLNPPQASSSNAEKRNHKPEPIISSINGTEAWGAPVRSSQVQQSRNDNSGNTTISSSIGNNNQQQSQPLEPVAAAAYSQAAAVAPSRDLLKQMVHQIQLAVQAGHLDAHILNQQMSTPTLQLVYQLLQQIKKLQELQEVQQCAGTKSYGSSPTNMDLQINRIRQNISILQKAITQQQAVLTKNDVVTGGDSNVTGLRTNNKQAIAPNNFSYASISKLSTNMKVPQNTNMSNLIGISNIDSFRRSGFTDNLSNSNSDSLRSTQAAFNANTNIDKTLSSLIVASSSVNNILGSSKPITTSGDFSKAQLYNSCVINQHPTKDGLLSAQEQSSSASSAWSAFNSGDFGVSHQAWPSQLRISSNVSQDQQHRFSAFDMMSDFGPGNIWRDASSEGKDNSSMAPGSNMNIAARPNSASNNLKQMNENNILSRDSSLFCDWSNNSDSSKRNFDHQLSNTASSPSSSFNPSAIGGLSLQSNPWMFAAGSSSLNIGSGIDNVNKNGNGGIGSGGNSGNKMHNGNMDKVTAESLFLKSNNSANVQRSNSALYDWSDLASSTMQLVNDNDLNKHNRPTASSPSSSMTGAAPGGGRPAPPPGLLSNFGSLIGGQSSMANGISILDSKLTSSANDNSQPRQSPSSLWSGAWFD